MSTPTTPVEPSSPGQPTESEESSDVSLQQTRRRQVIRSIKMNVFFCVLIGVMAATATDGGSVFQIWYFATAAYWTVTLLVWALHRTALSGFDVVVVSYGFVIALLTVPFAMNFFWRLYGMT